MVSQHLQIKYVLNNERMGTLVIYPVTVMLIDDINILTWLFLHGILLSPGMAAAISKHAFPSSCTVVDIMLILAPIHRPAPKRYNMIILAGSIFDGSFAP